LVAKKMRVGRSLMRVAAVRFVLPFRWQIIPIEAKERSKLSECGRDLMIREDNVE
jgi:hypothetical protein